MARVNEANRKKLDWAAARQRLADASAQTDRLDARETERVLEERARKLARRTSGTAVEAKLELLQITLGREHFAIETRFAREVLLPGLVTKLPGAPEHLRGVTNLRGDIMPVFDLRVLLGAARIEPTANARHIMLGGSVVELCVLADAVHEIVELPLSEIMPLDEAGASATGRAYLRGVTRGACSVIDLEALLSGPDLFIGHTAIGSEGSR